MSNYSEETIEKAKYIYQKCIACGKCMEDCLMLTKYCKYPGELFGRIAKEEEVDPIVPYSCMLCERCTIVCPLHLEMGAAFMSMRKDLMKEKKDEIPLEQLEKVKVQQKHVFSEEYFRIDKGEKR